MRKGISPIVAVVLLIAIAVIAAVGLYFWVGGLATKQPTPDTPATITAYAVQCNTSTTNGAFSTIIIANTSPPGSTAIVLSTGAEASNTVSGGSMSASNGANIFDCGDSSLASGEQTACKMGCNSTAAAVVLCIGATSVGTNGTNFTQGSGTVSIFGNSIAGAQVTC